MNNKRNNGRICVFGSYNLDIVAKAPRLPKPGESMIANGSNTGPGGKGANQAIAASSIGAKVHYIGKLGDDYYAKMAREHLEQTEIDVLTLFISKTKPTGSALIFVSSENAENMIVVDPGANLTITTSEIAQCLPVIKASDVLLTQLENNVDAIEILIETAFREGVFTILNPAPFQKFNECILSKVDVITPNEIEAFLLTGITILSFESAFEAASILHAKGTKNIIITMGSKGAFLSDTTGTYIIPPYPTVPIDTTGAGDAFSGALAAKIAEGLSLVDACLFASAVASCSVEKNGTSLAMPDILTIEKKMTNNPIIPIKFDPVLRI
ncbi:ribokinase [Vibrio sp. S12_S33]|uniref:ribokinase n=1 Tax=Vibrio sp. S12_S33 TaxID=2720223 RepID=UPI00178107DA|nr:ribokinase [Vibrio sp. S12_S33]MBD1567403.1 ribokinase [Vibrio sp. S12_S33]